MPNSLKTYYYSSIFSLKGPYLGTYPHTMCLNFKLLSKRKPHGTWSTGPQHVSFECQFTYSHHVCSMFFLLLKIFVEYGNWPTLFCKNIVVIYCIIGDGLRQVNLEILHLIFILTFKKKINK